MKLTFKVEYDKQEKLEGRHDLELVIPNLRASVRHPQLTRYFYGFLTSIGYILSIRSFEDIEED